MHSVTHLIESIRGKGVTANTTTGNGEALHPQTKKYWVRTNHQPEKAEDQVCLLSPSRMPCTVLTTVLPDDADGV